MVCSIWVKFIPYRLVCYSYVVRYPLSPRKSKFVIFFYDLFQTCVVSSWYFLNMLQFQYYILWLFGTIKYLYFMPFCQIYHFEKFSFSSRNPHSLPSFPSPLPYAFLNTAIDNPPSPYALHDIQHSPSFHFVKQHLISHHPTTP